MNIKTTEANGKHTAQVIKGDSLAFTTPTYYTSEMALAAAKCWVAFHGEDEIMTPGMKRAMEVGLAMRAKMDARNTVTVSSGTHVLSPMMAFELRKPAPHPRNGFDLNRRMADRQNLILKLAELLNIPYAEAKKVPAQLRRNEQR